MTLLLGLLYGLFLYGLIIFEFILLFIFELFLSLVKSTVLVLVLERLLGIGVIF